MTIYSLEPRDTLSLRDGAGSLGNVMRTLPFPWPSSVTGLLRTRSGLDPTGKFAVPRSKLEALRQGVRCRGPLLAQLGAPGVEPVLFTPAPLDAVWFDDSSDGSRMARLALRPEREASGTVTDLGGKLELVGLPLDAPKSKATQGPVFWRWRALEEWLLADNTGARALGDDVGINGFSVEERTSVTIDPSSGTAADGDLFSIEGLRLVVRSEGNLQRFGFIVDAEINGFPEPANAVVALGGKRRPTFMTRIEGFHLPTIPDGLSGANARRFRVVLLTPGLFGNGHLPKTGQIQGARIVAAITPRPIALSGWDFDAKRPKPSRRAVPAGSVYWVELSDELDVGDWLNRVWMHCISDDEQDCADGFGLAVVGRA